LIFYHELDALDGNTGIVSYWESRADFDASRRPFEESCGVKRLVRESYLRRPRLPKVAFWRRFSAYEVVLHVVAFLGALAALEKHYDWLFQEPRVILQVGEGDSSLPIEILEGKSLRTTLHATNGSATVAAEVSLVGADLIGTNGSIPLRYWTDFSSLKEKETDSVPFSTPTLKQGSYRAVVKGEASAGLLRGSNSITSERRISVWSQKPTIDLRRLDRVGPTRANFQAVVNVGEAAEAGLDCEARYGGEPNVKFGPVNFPGVENWPHQVPSNSGTVWTQSWTTPKVDQFSHIRFGIVFDGVPLDGWRRFNKRLHVVCGRRKQKEET
jgi:hypothetical protein